MKNEVLLSLGSNCDAAKHIPQAMSMLREQFADIRYSTPKEYEPIDFHYNENLFTNLVASFSTDMNRQNLIRLLKEIEDSMGRKRAADFDGFVSIDLDLILWNGHLSFQADCQKPYVTEGMQELGIECPEAALSFFHNKEHDWNCAQTIQKRFQYLTGLSDEEIEAQFRPMGGGRSPQGYCGALYAANLIAKSLGKEELTESFEEQAGARKCAELRKIPGTSCKARVCLAEQLVLNLLKEE